MSPCVGVNHGFITRGDFSDAHVKKSADKAMAEAVALFIDTTGPTAPDSCSSEGITSNQLSFPLDSGFKIPLLKQDPEKLESH